MVSGSRQRNSIARAARGTRSRTQIIVGTSSTTISTTVNSASSSDATIDGAQVLVGDHERPVVPGAAGSAAGTWVEKSNIASSGTKK